MLDVMFLDLKSNHFHLRGVAIDVHDYIKKIIFPVIHVPSNDHQQHLEYVFIFGMISGLGSSSLFPEMGVCFPFTSVGLCARGS